MDTKYDETIDESSDLSSNKEDEVTYNEEPATETNVRPVERTSTTDTTKYEKDWMLQKLGLIKPAEKVREVVNVHADVEHEVEPIHRPGEFFPVKVTRRQSLALRQVIDCFALVINLF